MSRSTLMLRIFACGATPMSNPPPISPAASDEVQEPWPFWSAGKSNGALDGSGTSQLGVPNAAE